MGAVVGVGRGVMGFERLVEARVGRWRGWISEGGMGGKGLPFWETETLGLDLGLPPFVDLVGSLVSVERLWKSPLRLESTLLPFEIDVWDLKESRAVGSRKSV